jgi:RNA polymerase sigma factor (sigma-70 family)
MRALTKQQGGPGNNTETTLFEHAQAGCRQSLNLLMSRHEGLIHAVIHEQYLYGLPYEEALQAGRSALWRAIMGYEPQRGTAFSTYAWIIIMRAVWLEVKGIQKGKEWGVLEESWEDESQEPGREHERGELREMVMGMVTQLPVRQQRIVYERYGWGGEEPATFREIGEGMGMSKQRAHQLHQEAILRLRQPALSYALRNLFEQHRVSDYAATAAETALWLQRRGGRLS